LQANFRGHLARKKTAKLAQAKGLAQTNNQAIPEEEEYNE
jgi:hypothetical protein